MKKSGVVQNFEKKVKESKTVCILCGIIFLILVASLAAIVLAKQNKVESRYANIYQNGNLVRTLELEASGEVYTFTIYGEHGEENTIEVRDGKIGMISANCPDHLCVDMGFISTGAMPVTCLPNNIVIEITGRQDAGLPDGVAY